MLAEETLDEGEEMLEGDVGVEIIGV